MQAAANEGFSIYSNSVNQPVSGPGSASVKPSHRHSRHQSNPSWILLEGANMGAQQIGTKIGSAQHETRANVSVQMPRNSQVVVTERTSMSKPRSKQIN